MSANANNNRISIGGNLTKLAKLGSTIRNINLFEDSDLTKKINTILEDDLKSTAFTKTVTVSKNKMVYSTSKDSSSKENTGIQKQTVEKIKENIHVSLRKIIGNIL